MTTWTDEQLDRLGGAPEIEIAPRRADGSLREYTTIWIVQAGDGLFVRSFNGPGGSWFTSARRSGAGRIRVGGAEIDVELEPQDHLRGTVDDAYRAKYGRSAYLAPMVADDAAGTTLRLVPA